MDVVIWPALALPSRRREKLCSALLRRNCDGAPRSRLNASMARESGAENGRVPVPRSYTLATNGIGTGGAYERTIGGAMGVSEEWRSRGRNSNVNQFRKRFPG
eukprot:scaffold259_cov252-Pinguiococcus_pyrenoidosus.AAC.36